MQNYIRNNLNNFCHNKLRQLSILALQLYLCNSGFIKQFYLLDDFTKNSQFLNTTQIRNYLFTNDDSHSRLREIRVRFASLWRTFCKLIGYFIGGMKFKVFFFFLQITLLDEKFSIRLKGSLFTTSTTLARRLKCS